MSATKLNDVEAIRFYVHLSFVSPDNKEGYQKTDVSHEETREKAIVEVLARHMNEKYPLKGITLYKLNFAC